MKIITPATAEPISLALARKQCKIDAELVGSPLELFHEDDELLEVYITAAREWCEDYLGLLIAPTVVEIRLSDFDGDITLESGPVLFVNSIAYTDADGVDQVVDDALYALDTTGQVAVVRLVEDAEWPTSDGSNDNISVMYSIGYSAVGDSPQDAPLPKRIKVAMLLIVAHLNKNREETVERALSNIPMGVRSMLGPLKLRKGFA